VSPAGTPLCHPRDAPLSCGPVALLDSTGPTIPGRPRPAQVSARIPAV